MAHEEHRIPCPDRRTQHYAGLYVVDHSRIAAARCSATKQAAAARLAHYIARRSARRDGFIPGDLVEIRSVDSSPGEPVALVCVRAEIVATPA